jgi:hypothetical protein
MVNEVTDNAPGIFESKGVLGRMACYLNVRWRKENGFSRSEAIKVLAGTGIAVTLDLYRIGSQDAGTHERLWLWL